MRLSCNDGCTDTHTTIIFEKQRVAKFDGENFIKII